MVTIGEKIMNFASLAAPLLLSLAFAALFLLSKSKQSLAPNLLLVATIVAISGIAVFACLNVYNIIEVFNIISKSNGYVGESFRNNYISILVNLISYQILLVFYAGCLANFSSAVKRTGLPSNGVLIAFGLSNALLALWHALLLIKPAKFLEDYFTKYNLAKTGFTFSEIANVICFAAMTAFALSFYVHTNKEQKA